MSAVWCSSVFLFKDALFYRNIPECCKISALYQSTSSFVTETLKNIALWWRHKFVINSPTFRKKHITSSFRVGRGANTLKKKPAHSLNAMLNFYQTTSGTKQMTVFAVVNAMRTKVYLTKCAAYVILISKWQSVLECSGMPPRRFKSYTALQNECRSKSRTGKDITVTERHTF
jgi:hypothetical protein